MKAYKERKTICIDWDQVLGFLFAMLLTALVVVFCAGAVYAIKKEEKRDEKVYNEGIHQDCGGEWEIKGISNGYYTYECDKCRKTFTTTKNFNSLD